MARNNGYIAVTFKIHKEGHRWVACCEELGTATFGRSIPEAERKLEEAVFLHLNTLEDLGETTRFFAEHSIKYHSGKPPTDLNIQAPIKKETFYKPYIQLIPALSG